MSGWNRPRPVRRHGFLLAALAVSVPAAAEPPPLRSAEDPRYSADVLVFHEEDRQEALVWMVVHCPLSSIFFEPESTRAEMSLSWKVSRGRRQVHGDVIVRRVDADASRREEAAVLQSVPVRLEPGRYEVEIELAQPGSGRRSVVTREVNVEEIASKSFGLSSLFLSAEPPGRLGRRAAGLPGFPIVPRVVGDGLEHISLMGEIYAPHGCRERFRVTYRLVNDYERVIQQRTEEVPCEGFRTSLVLPLDTTNVSFGDYRIELTLEAQRTREKIHREIWFSADESLLPLKANFRRTLEIVEVIATPEEIEVLRDASPDEREAAWRAFWETRDPDPDTERNEYEEGFFERLRYANQHFGTATTRGWKSDRGRVLLEHGHPDRIRRNARSGFGADTGAQEIWEYVASDVTFVFIDDVGLGDFRLVRTDR